MFVSHLPQTSHSCIHGAKQAQASEGSAALRLVCGVMHALHISTPAHRTSKAVFRQSSVLESDSGAGEQSVWFECPQAVSPLIRISGISRLSVRD